MENQQVTDRQARSRSAKIAYLIGLAVLFFVGLTAGVWVSIRYFDTPVAELVSPNTRVPGRITGHSLWVPQWLDHPFRRRGNPYLDDFSYRTAMSDLNKIFFGEAMAAVPLGYSALGAEYESRKTRGLVNANEERIYRSQFQSGARNVLDHVSRVQANRAVLSARAFEEREDLTALRTPGTVLFLAAATLSGKAVRTRIGSSTVIRTQTVSKDDYRFQVDHEVTSFGLGVGSAYDSIDRRRSFSVRQNLSSEWAVGVDRSISSVADGTENTVRIQFAAPF